MLDVKEILQNDAGDCTALEYELATEVHRMYDLLDKAYLRIIQLTRLLGEENTGRGVGR